MKGDIIMSKKINLREVNKYLKTHSVSEDELHDMLMNDLPRFTKPTKPKQKRESYEMWELRTGGFTH